MQKKDWYLKTPEEVFDILQTSESGIEVKEAEERLKIYGQNMLPEAKVDGYFVIFLRQFQSPLIYILLLAGFVVYFTGDITDSLIIFGTLFINALIGVYQEGKAQNTLAALKKFSETKATVLRGGKYFTILDKDIVVGDVIDLIEGSKVPADARVISANEFKIDESSITGESEPAYKNTEPIVGAGLTPSDQKNMVFKGTNVVTGNGKAVVVETGVNTYIGIISKEISVVDTEIPLKRDIRNLSRIIISVISFVCITVFFLGVYLGNSTKEMFATVVSLAVSIIPEGISVVTTLVLATGVWRMSKKNALVKRLQAVEALGQARVIAVDKTGTVTKNEMTVQKVFVNEKIFDVGGVGFNPKGKIKLNGQDIDPLNHSELILAAQISAFCSNARTVFLENDNKWQTSGDPTEVAMLVFSEKIGFKKEELEKESPRIFEIPFSYQTKYHATVHKDGEKNLLTIVGAPESILKISSKIWKDGKKFELSEKKREEIEEKVIEFSKQGLRVIAFAEKRGINSNPSGEEVDGLTFVGLFGMKDPLRLEVKDALSRAELAGIRVVMITGDHKITAQAIAKEAGIFKEGDKVLEGIDIENLSEKELSQKLSDVSVFARTTPDHKLKIIKAYKSRGEIVAMTGDGVNDAPSLVAADLGVAMGINGTEVAKEAADIILLDDNFGSIISAVEEGRHIYKTIKKVVLYLFSTGWAEVLTIVGALFLGFPLPLLPAQIIWLNLITDGFLDVALSMEPKEQNLLQGRYKKPARYILDKEMIFRLLPMAITMSMGTLFLFSFYYEEDLTKALTISLTTLAVFQWFNVWNCRHKSKSIFKINAFSNKPLIFTLMAVIAFQFVALYAPFMQKILKTMPLTFFEWVIIILLASSVIFVEEIRKLLYRRKNNPN